ncbi:MAG: PRC-barrel domain-containing protein [Rhizobiaceae bacterium]
MVRKLLATTAVATLIATGAYAQSATTPAPATPAAPMESTPAAPALKADGHLASNIIGEDVYDTAAEDAKKIGDVKDIVIGADGMMNAVVVGVGGFLGLGQKDVAVEFSALDWAERNGDRWLVANTTKEQLEALPAFDRATYDPAPAANTAMAPAGTTPAPADQTAQAPATPMPAAPAANGSTDTMQTGAIDRSTLTELPADKMTAEELVGSTVYGASDANVGKVGDVLLTQDGKIDAYIIDVGGFLGIGAKKVAIGADNLSFMTDADGNKYLYTTFTKEQLEAQPTYDESTYAQQRDQQRLMVQ